MQQATTVNSIDLQQWVTLKMEPQAVEQELLARGYDESSITFHLKEYRRLKNASRLFTGFVCMGTGAFLGFLSCVLTIINAIPALYAIILFGLTSLAIVVILIGLYLVFE